jgi:hypothetical protein
MNSREELLLKRKEQLEEIGFKLIVKESTRMFCFVKGNVEIVPIMVMCMWDHQFHDFLEANKLFNNKS